MIRPPDAHVDHEMMLEHYGIAYVCQHPEILFDGAVAFARSPVPHNRMDYLSLGYATIEDRIRYCSITRQSRFDDATERMFQAYRILNELYAPWSAPYSHKETCLQQVQPGSRTHYVKHDNQQ